MTGEKTIGCERSAGNGEANKGGSGQPLAQTGGNVTAADRYNMTQWVSWVGSDDMVAEAVAVGGGGCGGGWRRGRSGVGLLAAVGCSTDVSAHYVKTI